MNFNYSYYFLIELIKENKVKFFLIILTCIFFMFAGTFENYTDSRDIEREVKVDTGWVYLYSKISDNKIKYELIYSDTRLEIKDGKLFTVEYHGANVFCWVGFAICLIILTVTMFSDGGEWEISDVRKSALGRMVRCELDNGIFYYTISGRLIGESKTQFKGYERICGNFGIYSLIDLKNCPEYESKSSKRERKLKKLGIYPV